MPWKNEQLLLNVRQLKNKYKNNKKKKNSQSSAGVQPEDCYKIIAHSIQCIQFFFSQT